MLRLEYMPRPLILLLAGSWLAVAATSSIGVIRSSLDFYVDRSLVRGDSTLFDGDQIETTAARSVLQLDGGQVTLAPDSQAKVYRDRTVLEKGSGLLRNAGKQVVEAGSLQIIATARDAVVQVDVQGPGRIAVAARSGSALVRNSAGVLVASLQPGMELAFDAGRPSSAARITGVPQMRNGNYYVTDPAAHVTIEVHGANLAQYAGKNVEITGSQISGVTPLEGASEVVLASSITPAPRGGGGGSHPGNYSIVGGVAISETIVGLASAGTFAGPPVTGGQ